MTVYLEYLEVFLSDAANSASATPPPRIVASENIPEVRTANNCKPDQTCAIKSFESYAKVSGN